MLEEEKITVAHLIEERLVLFDHARQSAGLTQRVYLPTDYLVYNSNTWYRIEKIIVAQSRHTDASTVYLFADKVNEDGAIIDKIIEKFKPEDIMDVFLF